MELWTKVRVANANAGDDADNHVWQGFYAGNNMGGVDVYVTADTLRRFVDVAESMQDEWDRLNNPYTFAAEALAFGTGAVKVPGTKVVVYPLFDMALEVVQRFDPTAGKTYSHRHADGTVTMEPYGAWVNVAPVLGNPKPMGFVINEQDYAEGRSSDQPFERVRMDEPEPEGITEEQSATVKAVLDFATPEVRDAIVKAYPCEADEWANEKGAGLRK